MEAQTPNLHSLKFATLSNSFELKSVKGLKKNSAESQLPIPFENEEVNVRSRLGITDTIVHDETINYVNKNATKTFMIKKKLSKIKKSLQTDISDGQDQHGILETIKMAIQLIFKEIGDSKELNLKKYYDYFDQITQALSTGTSRSKQPRAKLILNSNRSDPPSSIINSNNNNGGVRLSPRVTSDSTSSHIISPRSNNSGNKPSVGDDQRDIVMQEANPVFKSTASEAQQVLIKFVANEGSYLFDLKRVTTEYLPAIQRDLLLPKPDQKTIFNLLPELVQIHSALYSLLKDALKSSSPISPIFDSFIEKFKIYQQYSGNFSEAMECLERNIKDSKAFSLFLKQTDKKESTLQELLRKPLRRVEELIFALDGYAKALPQGSTERPQIEDNRDDLQEILDSIDQRESVADNLARVMEIGNNITQLDENLVRPDRRFILEGAAKIFKSEVAKKPIADYLFLFNDVLIFCISSGRSFEYVGRVYMDTVTVKDSAKAMTIEITENNKEKYYLTTQSNEEVNEWQMSLGKVIREVERTRKVFGVPLRTLLRRESPSSDLPVFVEKSLKFISDYGKDIEGIFRQTGRSTQIEKLKGQLNQGTKVFFSENMDVHTVATLFKLWLRELPDPLLTWGAYPQFLSALEQSSSPLSDNVNDDVANDAKDGNVTHENTQNNSDNNNSIKNNSNNNDKNNISVGSAAIANNRVGNKIPPLKIGKSSAMVIPTQQINHHPLISPRYNSANSLHSLISPREHHQLPARSKNNVAAERKVDEAMRVELFQRIIDHLPRENRYVAQHMFKCLYVICANEEKTKMNAANLAVVFAPNILRNPHPNSDPFDQSYFNLINEIFITLVKNYPKIFENVERERERGNGLKPKMEKREREKRRTKSNDEGRRIKAGYLFYFTKKKKWGQRYIVLKSSSLEISKSKEKKPKVLLDLHNASVASTVASSRPFAFNIDCTQNVSHSFAAKNSDEFEEWLHAIRQATSV